MTKKKPVTSRSIKKSSDKSKKDRGRKSSFLSMLDFIEKSGNKLPHPATLFVIFVLIIIVLSEIIVRTGVSAVHPGTGETVYGISLMAGDGIRWLFANAVDNFVHFPPLGVVLVVMIGIGVAEGSGLISAALRQLVLGAPKKMMTAAIVAAGILSHLASSAGYVLLIPLGAMIFAAMKRHPMAGIAAAFCGVSGGFGANFLIGSIDPILAGLSESAARIYEPAMSVHPAVNLYFMIASAFLVVIAGTWITEKIVEPRLGSYSGETEKFEELKPVEKKGLKWAGISMLVTLLVFTALSAPANGLLRSPDRPLNQRIGSINSRINDLNSIIDSVQEETSDSDLFSWMNVHSLDPQQAHTAVQTDSHDVAVRYLAGQLESVQGGIQSLRTRVRSFTQQDSFLPEEFAVIINEIQTVNSEISLVNALTSQLDFNVETLYPEKRSFLASPFMDGLITFLFIFFLMPGLVYGIVVRSVKNDKDMVKHMNESMKGLSSYIVLVFFAAQFVYCFQHSNLGIILAIRGAELLEAIGFTGIGLLVAFVILSAFINMFMGSASAKWAIMAPVFVPMFMHVGWHPGITQAAFRIGDSVTNIITPMMSYFALIVAFAQKYDEKYGIGTIIATMLPYTIILSVLWIILLIIWMLLGLPTGPGAPIYWG